MPSNCWHMDPESPQKPDISTPPSVQARATPLLNSCLSTSSALFGPFKQSLSWGQRAKANSTKPQSAACNWAPLPCYRLRHNIQTTKHKSCKTRFHWIIFFHCSNGKRSSNYLFLIIKRVAGCGVKLCGQHVTSSTTESDNDGDIDHMRAPRNHLWCYQPKREESAAFVSPRVFHSQLSLIINQINFYLQTTDAEKDDSLSK